MVVINKAKTVEPWRCKICVIIAKKCRLKGTKKEKFFLYKIRDRNYDPIYSLEVQKKNGVEALYLIDKESSWREGVNDKGLMIISAALDNHNDFDTGKVQKTKKSKARTKHQHRSLESAMIQKSVSDAIKILKNDLFIGTTFVSDGDRLTILEIYLNADAYDRESERAAKEAKDFEDLSLAQQEDLIYTGISREDYDIKSKQILKDRLVIRTNHGKLLDDAGYTPTDDELEGYKSSVARYDYSWDALEPLKDPHPFDILSALKNLQDVDKIGQHNPIRPKEKLPKSKRLPNGNEFKYYTSSVIMLSSTGIIFLVPILSEVDINSALKLKPDREVDFVILPKKLPLFESQAPARITGFKKFVRNQDSIHNRYNLFR